MLKTKYLILGAGPTGLGAGFRLREIGEEDFLILEATSQVGGLASSFVDEQGFTWDIGSHVEFSHYDYFDEVLDKALGEDGWLHHERASWVWMKNRFIPYPFQHNIRYLPKEALWVCFKGVLEVSLAGGATQPSNFLEWIHATFGAGIAEEFMVPYNSKVWAYGPEKMSYSWIGERVSVVDPIRIANNIFWEKDDLSWGPNNLFRYPKRGGTGAIWRSMGKLIGEDKIFLNSEGSRVSAKDRFVNLSNGEVISFEYLLSTIPLDRLCAMVSELPESQKRIGQELIHSTSNVVGIGLKGQPKDGLSTKSWMYFPENDCPFYRATLLSKFSPNNVPDPGQTFSLMTETSESADKPVDQESLVENTIQGLLRTNLIDPSRDVVSTWHYRAEYGYPTPSLKRDQLLREVIPALEAMGIYSRGRFGGWKYEVSNQDHTFMQGVEWADFMESGIVEHTFTI